MRNRKKKKKLFEWYVLGEKEVLVGKELNCEAHHGVKGIYII